MTQRGANLRLLFSRKRWEIFALPGSARAGSTFATAAQTCSFGAMHQACLTAVNVIGSLTTRNLTSRDARPSQPYEGLISKQGLVTLEPDISTMVLP